MTLLALREGLAARCATVEGLRASAYMPELIVPPVAIVTGPDIAYDEDSESDHYTFPVLVLVSEATDRSAHVLLDAYLASSGPSSVREAVENDDTLGGAAQYAQVGALRDYGIHEIQNTRYLGATFFVDVVAFK